MKTPTTRPYLASAAEQIKKAEDAGKKVDKKIAKKGKK